jgi:LysM repeat protein
MSRYPFKSRRRRRRRKWIYIVSVLLIVIAVKAFISGSNPVSTFGDEDKLGVSMASAQTEDSMVLSAPKPNLYRIPDLTSESTPESAAFINKVMTYINTKPSRIINARDKLNEMLSMPMSRQQLELVKKQLSKLSEEWLFSKANFAQDKLCSRYKVEPGDQLRTIGRKFKVPYEILMQINNIHSDRALQAGETIKVIHGPFHARIYRSTFTMDLYLQKTFVKSFPVGLGQPGMETPTGLWCVKPGGKLIKPTWTDHTGKTFKHEDPDYPLGSRWIGLEGIKGNAKDRTGFAIHGTKGPDQINTASSRGCIRLHNGDAILIYNSLMPSHSLVEIVE